MQIQYRGISLAIVFTRTMLRQAIETEDETTLLYIKHTIDVDCVYNPAATSFNPVGTVMGISATAVAGQFPPQTDTAIRQTLLQPQGQLILTDEDGRPILTSPLPGMSVDCKNGPLPQQVQVSRIHGTKTWQVRFAVVTYVNECPPSHTANPTRPILLSHRWKRYVDIDEDYFSSVITQGRCVFRADELVRLGQFPDQYRQQLFFAIPNNFKRWHIHVMPSEDGTTVDYTVTDKELAFNGPNCTNGTRIEAFQTAGYSEPNQLYEEMLGIARGVGAASFDVPAMIGNVARIGFETGARCLPSYSIHVICRVWGNRNSSRTDLMYTALGVCFARIKGNIFQIHGRSSETIITHELTGKYVEAQMTVRWGPEQAALNVAANIANIVDAGIGAAAQLFTGTFNLPAAPAPPGVQISNPVGFDGILSFFPANEELNTINLVPVTIYSQSQQLMPPPPNALGSRGTWVGQLVAQALSAPCAIPPEPQTLPIGQVVINPTNAANSNINAVTPDLKLY